MPALKNRLYIIHQIFPSYFQSLDIDRSESDVTGDVIVTYQIDE